MKVLYVLDTFPHLSESYKRTEIEWVKRQGVDVSVWSMLRTESPYPTDIPVTYDSDEKIGEAVARFKPDLIHTHWLYTGIYAVDSLKEYKVPMTVRGHSFDHHADRVNYLLKSPCIRRIFMFPHFSSSFTDDRIKPMTAVYDPGLYSPGEKDWKMVFRAATGRPGKDIESFFEIAAKLKREFRFVLTVTKNKMMDYVGTLKTINESLGRPVSMHVDLQHEEVANLSKKAGIYLRSHDPGAHPYGMPASVIEAMATGSFIVAREDKAARLLVEEAGEYFQRSDQAVSIIASTAGWTLAKQEAVKEVSIKQAEQYRTDHVLPSLLSEWEVVLKESW